MSGGGVVRFRRSLSLLLLAAYLPACTAYHQTGDSVAQLTAPPKPVERMRITKLDGTRVQVWDPRLALDSVIGVNNRPGKETGRVAVAVADIRSVETQKVDGVMTVLGVVGVMTVVSLFFVVVWALSCDEDEFC